MRSKSDNVTGRGEGRGRGDVLRFPVLPQRMLGSRWARLVGVFVKEQPEDIKKKKKKKTYRCPWLKEEMSLSPP